MYIIPVRGYFLCCKGNKKNIFNKERDAKFYICKKNIRILGDLGWLSLFFRGMGDIFRNRTINLGISLYF